MGKLPELKGCSLSLKTYTGESVKILGATDVIVQHGNQVRELPVVVVVSTDGPNLLSRGWIEELDICWSTVNQVTTESMTLQEVLTRHEAVFKAKFWSLSNFQSGRLQLYLSLNRIIQ